MDTNTVSLQMAYRKNGLENDRHKYSKYGTYNSVSLDNSRCRCLRILCIRRTDKWLSLFLQQAIEGTALIVIGNDGKTPI